MKNGITLSGYLFGLGLLSLSGCSVFQGDDDSVDSSPEYLRIKESPALKVPENYSEPTIIRPLEIPPLTATAATGKTGEALDLTPPVQILTVGEGMRLMRTDGAPGVFLRRSSATVLEALKGFLNQRELDFSIQEQAVDTDWVVEDNETWFRSLFGSELPRFVRAKYQFQFIAGQQEGEVGLLVIETETQKMPYDNDQWEPIDNNLRSATNVLNEFVGYLDYLDRRDNARRIAKLNRGFKVTLGRDDSRNASLIADTEWRTAWVKAPVVLAPFGFVLSDKDQSEATYFFQFTPNEPGFFAALVGDDDAIALDLPEGGYQLVVGGQSGGAVSYTFIDPDGEPLTDGVMAKIYPFLSEAFGRNNKL